MPLPSTLKRLLPPQLLAQCEPLTCSQDIALFLTGVRPHWMYFVCDGEVVLERHGQNGEVANLQRCQSGFVGEASLTSATYHCDARTTMPSKVVRIPIRALRLALQQEQAFAERWIQMLSSEVRRLRLQNERLSLPKVQSRVLHLIETEGHQGRYTLECPLKQLAKQLAVTHEALYRALAELEKTGKLQRNDKELCLIR
jgi:CRP/FNR family transcriptional regulator, dissimilatory nitrate respiration regulator